MIKDSSGNSLLSHLFFGNLPLAFKRQLILVLNNNYPTLDQIFDNYHGVIETLLKTSKNSSVEKNNNKGDGKINFKVNKAAYKPNAVQNFTTNNDAVVNTRNASQYTGDKYCKQCQIKGHVMNNCTHTNNYDLRVERAKQLNLCQLCSAARNATQQCFGNKNNLKYECNHCKTKAHISAFCPIKFKIVENVVNNICISLSTRTSNQLILPTITIEIFSGN